MKRKMTGILLAVMMTVVGIFATTTEVFANNNSTLSSDRRTVTTTYDYCKGSTIVYVTGNEENPSTGARQAYSQQKATTVTGSATFTHNPTRTGYLFVKSGLRAEVFVNGTSVFSIAVN